MYNITYHRITKQLKNKMPNESSEPNLASVRGLLASRISKVLDHFTSFENRIKVYLALTTVLTIISLILLIVWITTDNYKLKIAHITISSILTFVSTVYTVYVFVRCNKPNNVLKNNE